MKMDLHSFSFFLFTIIVVVIIAVIIPAESQEIENEKAFSYIQKSNVGPQNWGKINATWAVCSQGKMQSPIDILNEKVEIVSQPDEFQISYTPASAFLVNRGHDIMMKWEGDGVGSVRINGTEYVLKQLHWHSPSEHAIDGKKFALELHLVHESSGKRFAVLSILYKIGTPDSFLAELEGYIRAVKKKKHGNVNIGITDPTDVKMSCSEYYRYIGSLTTPPCTENVVWTIDKMIRTVSEDQDKLLREAVLDNVWMNARPIQATKERVVKLYRSLLKYWDG